MSYPACPKCGHAPLPADQSLPAACPACGIVLAKFAAAMLQPQYAEVEEVAEEAHPEGGFFKRWLLHVPDAVSKTEWLGRCALLVAVTLYTFKIFHDTAPQYGDLGGAFLHSVLLPWHEAGHVIFRPFGYFMTVLGGTLGQHLFPITLGVALLVTRRESFGAAIAFCLLGFSVMDMGHYMHDAGDPQMMMVNGQSSAETDGHDFINIFSAMGGWWLQHATTIGIVFVRIGQAMMLLGIAWGAWLAWLQKANLSDSPFAGSPFDRE